LAVVITALQKRADPIHLNEWTFNSSVTKCMFQSTYKQPHRTIPVCKIWIV